MPIYAYRCASCGFEKDHLQRLGEPVFEICPHCGQATYRKQVTAAGFQLKGTGWYATDFKGKGGAPAAPAGESDGKTGTKPADGAEAGKNAEVAKSTESAASAATSGATACGGN
ncbi:MAG TPA: zinc ribbon domain-containing protein [Accumulibacter sp.]|uniref:FmdB family zinc ribbon protein n=1 Tax=Accumulibacter sp. TaxID=2053492 RepID=UPI0025DB1B22|nr:zinc ribbon domain-containing protein [Accumulibacter sp.]MCM8598129.1 zinc ribbon domain-containing protein [Accumulibacter sp.]MCM8662284.1 zinc ribbon domain-containing protein [Accumulibacter sp.]HNC52457.1 zinc ribbon domain-containing protein [Accumulibacter sp.]